MANNLTIHIINSIPWSNLNRNEHGMPKSFIQGGIERGQLSSQSLKRAARCDYENQALGILSLRSSNLVEAVLDAAQRIDPQIDMKQATKHAKKLIGTLTKADKTAKNEKDDDTAEETDGSAETESGRSAWLSSEEIEAAANLVVQQTDSGEFIKKGKTGSLAIAAFGRMFANAPGMGTEAALSVSPAVSTHEAIIETDYFSTVDDNPTKKQGAGSSFLGVAEFTNGTFYRTVTIDRNQLRKSWTGMDSDTSRENLSALVKSLIYKLPRGKVKSTAPETLPPLVLIEEQTYRIAYDFETPVEYEAGGGFVGATIERLQSQRERALKFDPDNYGESCAVGGVAEDETLAAFNLPVQNLPELTKTVVDWILQ